MPTGGIWRCSWTVSGCDAVTLARFRPLCGWSGPQLRHRGVIADAPRASQAPGANWATYGRLRSLSCHSRPKPTSMSSLSI